jgi:hypothetical protein
MSFFSLSYINAVPDIINLFGTTAPRRRSGTAAQQNGRRYV